MKIFNLVNEEANAMSALNIKQLCQYIICKSVIVFLITQLNASRIFFIH